jgi:hypothetical protein
MTHHPKDHHVQLYTSDSFLVSAIADFFLTGDRAVIIATEAHRKAVEALLIERGFDVDKAKEQGSYISLDAAETLDKFTVEGMPDHELFFAVMSNILRALTTSGREVRAYGEMVALLAKEGNKEGAVLLEKFWNEMGRGYPFTLLCAYPETLVSDPSFSDSVRREHDLVANEPIA